MSLIYTVLHPDYVAILVVTIASFLFGWLWYSPLLFAKAWMAEMKFTPEKMQAAKPGMARLRCHIVDQEEPTLPFTKSDKAVIRHRPAVPRATLGSWSDWLNRIAFSTFC